MRQSASAPPPGAPPEVQYKPASPDGDGAPGSDEAENKKEINLFKPLRSLDL
ncbi:MAG: hypothetical protein M5U10_09385 [Candidatus Methanoperedens sp.]|uniref:hypothetical protein n=1 Tax=Candidatus Methanoperedens nitratireducens TaxID=1392998 RepID=UPI0012FF2AFD|nr:hypothetical protein [Candidatus Methanoperedens nitroreducens]MDJ1422113.1 hypothetical protein [Candidatus Methanoperedens sp.]